MAPWTVSTAHAGGESASTAAGPSSHENYSSTLGTEDYRFNQALPCGQLRPDAVNYAENIVRELKPDTPAGMAKGWRQVNGYKEYLEGLTSDTWTAVADVYKR